MSDINNNHILDNEMAIAGPNQSDSCKENNKPSELSNYRTPANSVHSQQSSQAQQAKLRPTPQMSAQQQQQQQQTQQHNHKRPTSSASILSIGSGIGYNNGGGGGGDKKQHRLKSRFTVLKKLGKGTYGKVQLAINKETGQEVAIKTIKKTKIENEQDLQRVRREIQIMSSIEHPHIIHIYEVFENKDKIVLIMQYAPGGELYEYVSQSKVLDDSEARRLFRQIATAIYYCHQNKICHRDLKLENILLDEKNNAKIADFGLSNVFDKRRQLKTFCGSPLYASPEIVQGSPYEGPEVDCWSLGVLLYTLVYGAMPFDGSNFKRLVKQISEACYYEPKQRSQASPLINRLLCADPMRRANILDICSDPWVNNNSPARPLSPRVSPTTNGQQQQPPQHPSLLKVAQDMANLTPVRVDILLALTPAPPPTSATQQVTTTTAADSAAPTGTEKHSRPPTETKQARHTNRHHPTMAMDPTLMEVDENRSTSPVANYIVRNLDGPPVSENSNISADQPTQVKEDPISAMEVSAPTPSAPEKPIPEPTEDSNHELLNNSEPEQSIQVDASTDDQQMSNLNEPVAKHDAEVEVKVVLEGSQKDSVQVEVKQSVDMQPNGVNPEIMQTETQSDMQIVDDSIEQTTKDDALTTKETSMDIDVKEPGESTEVPSTINLGDPTVTVPNDVPSESKTIPQELPESKLQPQAEIEGASKEEGSTSGAVEEEKPKKKKKIIVVKKKKKVTKRDTDGAGEENTSNDKSESGRATSASSTKQLDDAQSSNGRASSRGPGKVRIPDTFQPTDEETAQPAVQKASVTSRRQSALIEEVSQKLLQQHQRHLEGSTSSGAAIDADQPQLTGVRVSDKKSEFERRASVIAAGQSPPPSRARSSNDLEGHQSAPPQEVDLQQTAREERQPLRVEGSRESLRLLDKFEQTTVEHIDRKQPLDLEPPKRLKVPDMESSEPITPTGGVAPNLQPFDDLLACRLSECADRLRAEQRSPSSLEAIRDDRSDSVDTIRAELPSMDSPLNESLPPLVQQEDAPSRAASVRSSLQVNLVSGAMQQATNRPADQQTTGAMLGPTPITRSYKKVTFTKDGTCITETGKIYSTQADDGTVRRVERKSKVTHYPGEGSGDIGAHQEETSEETHEEVILEGGSSQAWQGSQSSMVSSVKQRNRQASPAGPFERLIMPSSDLFSSSSSNSRRGPFDDGEELEESGNIWPSGQSPFEARRQSYQQRARADSASSCSSGSTDVFDDTFDTWTGAMGMFNQGRRISQLHNSLVGKAFGATGSPLPFTESIFAAPSRRRPHQRPQSGPFGRSGCTSSTGTPRCESVEPRSLFDDLNRGPTRQHHHHHRHSRRHGSEQDRSDGYESDAAFDEGPSSRSTAGLGSARGRTFGSSNLFPRPARDTEDFDDPFRAFGHKPDLFGDSLFKDLQMEHERLKQRLSQHHKQLWRGSSPSLHQQQQQQQQQQPTQKQQQQQHQEGLHQSQSSSSGNYNVRQSAVPLSATPIRRNTAHIGPTVDNLPPRQPTTATTTTTTAMTTTRRSTSRTSLISNQMANVQISNNSQSQTSINRGLHHHVASFIELKRTPSNLQQQQQQQQQSTCQEDSGILAGGQTNPSASGSASATSFWNERSSPLLSSSNSSSRPTNLQEIADSRVQSWLQQSAGNLSVSSGSKSSASDTIASSSSRSEQCQMFAATPALQPDDSQPNITSSMTMMMRGASSQQHQLPPTAPSRSPNRAPVGNQQAMHRSQHMQTSTSSMSRTLRGAPAWFDEPDGGDSLSGSAADLESRSSSSLLDQLRARGYRSMINQRIQPAAVISEVTAHQEQVKLREEAEEREHQSLVHTATSSCSSINGAPGNAAATITTSSRSRFVTSTTMKMSGQPSNQQPSSPPGHRHDNNNNDNNHEAGDNNQSLVDRRQLQSVCKDNHNNNIDNNCENCNYLQKPQAAGDDNDQAKQQQQQQQQQQQKQKQKQQQPLGPNEIATEKRHEQGQSQAPNINENGHEPLQVADTEVASGTCDGHRVAGGPGEPQTGEQEQEEEEEEDMDEDVREAKANIKEYLDRMRETEKFLKSMHEEEENMERQRQKLFEFNQLLLSTKLNGIRASANQSSNFHDFPAMQEAYHHQAMASSSSAAVSMDGSSFFSNMANPSRVPKSAPVWGESDNKHAANNAFISSSIGSTFANSSLQDHHHHPSDLPASSAFSCFSSDLYRPLNQTELIDPLEPVQPVYLHGNASQAPSSAWRRSKSQLGDQFYNDISRTPSQFMGRTGRRPLGANIDSLSGDTNPYFPSSSSSSSRHRRSLSQMRTPTGAGLGGGFHHHSQAPVMSEYRSAFVSPLATCTLISSSSRTSAARSPMRRPTSPLLSTSRPSNNYLEVSAGVKDDEDDDEDHGMAAYRAHSYVPRVVPEGGPSRVSRSRDYGGRRFSVNSANTSSPSRFASSRLASLSSPVASPTRKQYQNSTDDVPSTRRTSLQTSSSLSTRRDRSKSPLLDRRRSLVAGGGVKFAAESAGPENSRLSELEQRIQANKRRRQELLAGELASSTGQSPNRHSSSSSKSMGNLNDIPSNGRLHEENDDDDDDDDDLSGFERPSTTREVSSLSATPSSTPVGKQQQEAMTVAATSSQRLPGSRPRSSRLESMEARIKRRSYCVRMASPERPSRRSVGQTERPSQSGLLQRRRLSGETTSGDASNKGQE